MPKLIGSSFEEILRDPTRAAIVKSILSREDASTFDEIRDNIHDVSWNKLYRHLETLVKREIVVKELHPTKTQKRNNLQGHQTYMYYISPVHEELQNVLQKMFPVEYSADLQKG